MNPMTFKVTGNTLRPQKFDRISLLEKEDGRLEVGFLEKEGGFYTYLPPGYKTSYTHDFEGNTVFEFTDKDGKEILKTITDNANYAKLMNSINLVHKFNDKAVQEATLLSQTKIVGSMQSWSMDSYADFDSVVFSKHPNDDHLLVMQFYGFDYGMAIVDKDRMKDFLFFLKGGFAGHEYMQKPCGKDIFTLSRGAFEGKDYVKFGIVDGRACVVDLVFDMDEKNFRAFVAAVERALDKQGDI